MDWETNRIQGNPPLKTVRVSVRGEPKSKQRPRVVKGRTYTPKETIEAEAIVAETYWAKTDIRFENQVVISIDFYNGNRRRRDIDNMAKLVLDALQGVAFDDDFQVVGLNLRKFLTTKEKARTEIAIYEVVVWPYESKDVP